MGTDDERREVAQNMRDGVKSKTEFELMSLNGSSAAIRWLISYVVFGDKKYHSGVDLMNRLADLIEPDTTSDTTKPAEDTTKTPTSSDTTATHTDASATCDVSQSCRSDVDRGALLVLADEMDDLAEAWGGKYPTNRVAAYARSIREALGVES